MPIQNNFLAFWKAMLTYAELITVTKNIGDGRIVDELKKGHKKRS